MTEASQMKLYIIFVKLQAPLIAQIDSLTTTSVQLSQFPKLHDNSNKKTKAKTNKNQKTLGMTMKTMKI